MAIYRKTPYVSLNLTIDARDELRRATIELTTPTGRRLSMSEVLIVFFRVAMNHPNEIENELKKNN